MTMEYQLEEFTEQEIKFPDTGIITEVRDVFPALLECIESYVSTPKQTAGRTLFRNKILAMFPKLFIFTEAFWQEFAFMKDNISIRFGKRTFPAERVVVPPPTSEEIAQDKIRKQRFVEYIQQARAKYGRGFSIQLADADHVDENERTTYKELPINKYNGFVRQDVIDRIFELCVEHKLYFIQLGLYCSLVCSREFCHLVLNSKISDFMFNPEHYRCPVENGAPGEIREHNPIASYMEIVHHSLFYGFHLLYREECLMKGYSTNLSRHVMLLDSFNRIPGFSGAIEDNPFIPLTLSEYFLRSEDTPDHAYIIKPIRRFNNIDQYRGFYSSWSFWIRFDIFTNGIFRGLVTDKVTFGGSIIPACMVRNPLESLFGINYPRDQDMTFDTLLPASDPLYPIQMNRFSKLRQYWDDHRGSVDAYFDEYYPSKAVISPEFYQSGDVLKYMELEDILSDIDIQIDVTADRDFDMIVMDIYRTVETNIRKSLGWPQSIQLSRVQLRLVKIQSENTYKYYVTGTLLKRSLEIFRFYGITPIGGISRYHFPCVRGLAIPDMSIAGILYGRALINPSLASFAYTGLMVDYRWMTYTQNAPELILKYYVRGCVMMLNRVEQQSVKEYCINNPRWSLLLDLFSPDRDISINHPIFRPRENCIGFYKKIQEYDPNYLRKAEYKYLIEQKPEAPAPRLAQKIGVDMGLRFTSGNLKPIAYWKVDAYLTRMQV